MQADTYHTEGAFVQLFQWSWSDIAAECEDYLGPKGFKAVQISPPQEHIQGSAWWTVYQPVSYELTSRFGNEASFKNMIDVCAANNVDIIVDAVINHMASGSGTGVAGSSFGSRTYEAYNQSSLHHYSYTSASNCQVNNYNDAYNVQYCDLSSLPDLATEDASIVQPTLMNYLNHLQGLGCGGLRIDAAKHIDSSQLHSILSSTSMFVFQEVIYGSGEPITPDEYYYNGFVTEFNYAGQVDYNIINQYKMVYFESFGTSWGLIPDEYSVVFLDNHDTQRNGNAQLTYKNGNLYQFAAIFMLAHPYGYPVVMSSYYFTDFDQGPPLIAVHGSGGQINCQDGVNWVCEHRWTAIGNMVSWRNSAGLSSVTNWQNGDDGNKIAFARGGSSFIAFNRGESKSWGPIKLMTSLPAGTYCNIIQSDDIGQSCNGHEVIVGSDKTATITIPPLSAVAIHIGCKL